MIIPIPRSIFGISYGSSSQYVGFADGDGAATLTSGIHPIAVPGIVRRLRVFSTNHTEDTGVELRLENISTALGLTLGAAEQTAANLVDSVTLAAGDSVGMFIGSDHTSPPFGHDMGIGLEWESTHQVFGISAVGGTVVPGAGWFGGAFGNGSFQEFPGSGESNTYSICGIPGAVTHLCLRRYGVESGGAWTAYIRRNGATQLDTICTLDDAGPAFRVAEFFLPCTPYVHRCDVLVLRSGSNSSQGIAAGVGFLPTVPGSFMLCGGSNDTIPITQTWKWNNSRQNGDPIDVHEAPISTAFTARGLYVERAAPGIGATFTQTLLRNGLPTNIVALQADLATSASGAGRQAYSPGNLITLQIDSAGDGVNSGARLHWVLGAFPLTATIGPLAWVHWPRRIP